MRILTVVGNRPAVHQGGGRVGRCCASRHEEILVHTGQHYDDSLSRVFFTELGLAAPERELGIGGGVEHLADRAHAGGARAAAARERRPTRCSSTATPTRRSPERWRRRRRGVPVVHVEAGMRSFDRSMPEELNRVLTDHLSDAAAVRLARRPRENLRARVGSRARARWSAT